MLANLVHFIRGKIRSNDFSNQKAYSLFEIMMTISLILILSAVGLGIYVNFQSNLMLNQDIYDVRNLMEQAQFKALKNPTGDPYGIFIDTAAMELVLFRDTYTPGNLENMTLQLDKIDGIELNLEPDIGTTDLIIFEVSTGKTQNHGSFELQNSNNEFSHTFNINSQGAIE